MFFELWLLLSREIKLPGLLLGRLIRGVDRVR